MSKKKTYASGKSTRTLLNLRPGTINRLTERNLKSVVTRLSSTANKRIKAIERAGLYSRAAAKAVNEGGLFGVRGKNLDQIKAEYLRVKEFLQGPTTVTEVRKIDERFYKSAQARDEDITEDEAREAMRIFDELRDNDPAFADEAFRYNVRGKAIDLSRTGMARRDIINTLRKDINDYKARQDRRYKRMSTLFKTQ